MSAEVFRLCGCLTATTKDEALVLHKIVTALGGGGFEIQHVTTNDDGSETRRAVKA